MANKDVLHAVITEGINSIKLAMKILIRIHIKSIIIGWDLWRKNHVMKIEKVKNSQSRKTMLSPLWDSTKNWEIMINEIFSSNCRRSSVSRRRWPSWEWDRAMRDSWGLERWFDPCEYFELFFLFLIYQFCLF